MESSRHAENRSRRRHWEWLLLLLALLMSFACVFLSTWLSLSEWPDQLSEASMLARATADYRRSAGTELFAPMDAAVVDEAATDAARLQLTPSVSIRGTPLLIVMLPATPTPSATLTPTLPSAVTATAGPIQASATPTHGPTLVPSPTASSTPTPTAMRTATRTATPTLLPTPTATASSTPLPPTETSTPRPPPTNTPEPTHTPHAHPPTDTPVPPTDTPVPPTDTPTNTPTPDLPPAPPANLRAAAGNQQVSLGWDPNTESDLAGYRIYRDGGFLAQISGTSRLDTGLTNSIVYTYWVTAIDNGGHESFPITASLVSAQPYDITPFTYTTAVTCSGSIRRNCSDAQGPPDGTTGGNGIVAFDSDGVITLDFGAGNGIMDGPGADLVFFERPLANADGNGNPGIQLDPIRIALSADGTNWYTVFEWDGDNPGDTTGTNVDAYAHDANGELENEYIPSDVLYSGGLPDKINTGITINIGAVPSPPPPGYSYRFVRFTYPGGTAAAEVDAVQRLN